MNYISVMILLFLPTIAFAGGYQEHRVIDLPVNGIDQLVVRCGAGSLQVRGVDDLTQLQATAVIELAGGEETDLPEIIKNNLRFTLEKRKDKALLSSTLDIAGTEKLDPRIHLKVEIPKGMHLQIVDGSGSIRVLDLLGNLKIDDDSGAIEIENCVGRLTVEDSSGSITIDNISGKVFVKDGSGWIDIADVHGDVFIVDGSGDIVVSHIAGNVTVVDGSGDIDISDVSANVSIREAGSGELSLERIAGKITTPDEPVETE